MTASISVRMIGSPLLRPAGVADLGGPSLLGISTTTTHDILFRRPPRSGCSNLTCPQCALCQKRRCSGSFKKKYLAPSDVLEARCGAQVYVVVVDTSTGHLVQYGLEDTFLELSLVDGRKLEIEQERPESLETCQVLANKSGQPLLIHGRSGAYSDNMRILVPMISGQAMLPDLKVTDSSEALLSGRAPPFRLLARVVQRGGIPLPGIAPVLSEPFVVATARVRAASKLEIPHVDDSISKIEGLGVQTQKKLEDIGAAAEAVDIPRSNLQVPRNSVTKVGEYRELIELAETNKSLKETLKHVLRLTNMWDVARDHARKAVTTDTQLRVYHPDNREEVGLVYRCIGFNVIDINRPLGLLRQLPDSPTETDKQIIDIIWLGSDITKWPDAVRRIVPRAASNWWMDGHPGWEFLPLTTQHLPQMGEKGPVPSMSSFSFNKPKKHPSSGKSLSDVPRLPGFPGLAGLGAGTGFPQLPSTGMLPNGNSGGSPFEDPTYLMALQAAVGADPSNLSTLPSTLPPRGGNVDSDGGTKRKADASLETWMALNKSLDGVDLDLPSTLAGVESLLLQGGPAGVSGVGAVGGVDSSLLANLGSLGLLSGGSGRPSSIMPDHAPVTVPGVTMGDVRDEFGAFFAAGQEDTAARERLHEFLLRHGMLRDVPVKAEAVDEAMAG